MPPSPVTEVDLCNQALANVGQTQFISSLSAASTPAQLCAVLYPQCRDVLLELYDWQFARWHAQLSLYTSTQTRDGWQYYYNLPFNFLAARYVWAGVRPGAPLATISPVANPWVSLWTGMPFSGFAQKVSFGLELSDDGTTNILGTDQQNAELIYTSQVTTVAAFRPLFKEAIVTRLTAKLWLSLVKKPALHDTWMKRFDVEAANAYAAQLREAQEDPNRDAEAISVRG